MSTIIAIIEKQLIKHLVQFKPSITYSLFNKTFSTTNLVYKQKIDRSKVPVIDEKDLREQFVHGSGPGGQNVNKLSNCVVLKHLPTGIVVKCHIDRQLQKNRVIARQLLQTKLDDFINGSESVSAQKKRLLDAKIFYKDKKAAKLRQLKKEFKLGEQLRVGSESESKVESESTLSQNDILVERNN